MVRRLLLIALLGCGACTQDMQPVPATDASAGNQDGGVSAQDAAPSGPDAAGPIYDAGAHDGGGDAGTDAGVQDAGPGDASPSDGGVADGSVG